jgi:hypothetical protein
LRVAGSSEHNVRQELIMHSCLSFRKSLHSIAAKEEEEEEEEKEEEEKRTLFKCL